MYTVRPVYVLGLVIDGLYLGAPYMNLLKWINLNPAWVIIYIQNKMLYAITYPFSNVIGAAACSRTHNFLGMLFCTYPCLDWR